MLFSGRRRGSIDEFPKYQELYSKFVETPEIMAILDKDLLANGYNLNDDSVRFSSDFIENKDFRGRFFMQLSSENKKELINLMTQAIEGI